MPQYLLSVHGSEDSPYATPEEMVRAFRDVDALNRDIQQAGAWVFAGGLQPASTAKVSQAKAGELVHTDGPYLQGQEHIGGSGSSTCRMTRRRCPGQIGQRSPVRVR
jgi:hypothetical protein